MAEEEKIVNEKTLDVRAIVARLGGPTKVLTRLTERGYRLSLSAVEKWCIRERIPSTWLALLIDIGREIRKPINPSNYVTERFAGKKGARAHAAGD